MDTGRPLPRPPRRRQFGLIRRLMSDPRPVLDELCDEFGPIVGLGAGPMRLAIVGDPPAMREMFSTPVDAFRWGHRFNVLGFVVGGDSLIVSDGPDWERRRSSLRSGFSRRRLNGWVPTIVALTDAHLHRVMRELGDDTRVVDLYPVGRTLVQEVVVRTMFGARLAARSAEIAQLFESAQAYLESPFPRQLPNPLPVGRRATVRRDLQAVRTIIEEEMAWLRASPSAERTDVLADLVAAGDLSDDEIVDQVITLMGAGLDTTSATLAWVLWCTTLAGPELWQRLRAEADAVLTGDGGPYDERQLVALDLAGRVVRETTRLHPAGSFSPRMAHVDLMLAGYRIPRGTLIMWSAHLAGRDPRTWTDPLAFDPDRFVGLSDEDRAAVDLALVPFGWGARNCIGFALAQMELTLILARLVQHLDVEATATSEPDAVGMVVNRPSGGAPMLVSAR